MNIADQSQRPPSSYNNLPGLNARGQINSMQPTVGMNIVGGVNSSMPDLPSNNRVLNN
jgi:hypothetical protein